jgi:hypothetical protein
MILTLKREEEILFIVLFVVLLKLKMSTKNQLILKKNRIKKIKKK